MGKVESSPSIRHPREESTHPSELFQAMVESTTTGYFIVQGRRFLYTNPAFQALSGYTSGELSSMGPCELLRCEIPPPPRNGVSSCEDRQSSLQFEGGMIAKDGREKWVKGTIASLPHGQGPAYLGIITDITGQKRKEDALRRSERKYRTVFEMAPDTIVIHDTLGIIMDVNPEGLKPLSLSREEAIGRHGPMDTWCEEDKTRFPGLEEYLFRHGEWHGEIRGIDAEGVPRTCESRVKMIEIAGEPAILAVGRDITERKRMEEQVRNALREKETLLREIHHRVKNNMQIISTLLKLQSKNVQEGRTQALFRESQNRILSMAMIHEKLYQSEGIHKIDLKDYIHDLAHEVVASFGETRRGRITLTTDIHDIALGMDTAIPCGLILIELVSNSLKYAFPENRVGEIRIVFHSLGSAGFELTVADNGIGLPEDMDIHEQKSLGLRLVSDLAKYQLEGEMDVEGETGTTVRVQFPGSKGGSGEDG